MTHKKRNQSKRAELKQSTWLQVVTKAIGKDPTDLPQLYAVVAAHPKAAGKRNLYAKVRQILYLHPDVFVEIGAGIWTLARFFKPDDVKAMHRDRKKRLASRKHRTRT
jgi:hypothetical protein